MLSEISVMRRPAHAYRRHQIIDEKHVFKVALGHAIDELRDLLQILAALVQSQIGRIVGAGHAINAGNGEFAMQTCKRGMVGMELCEVGMTRQVGTRSNTALHTAATA